MPRRTFCDTLNRIAELLPCGHTWRRNMLYRRSNVWHYDFTVAGRRQRGTTDEVSESRARGRVPISERMSDLLMLRCRNRREGWLFPSPRAADGHLTTVAKQFREARSQTGLPRSLVLYCARHTFGT